MGYFHVLLGSRAGRAGCGGDRGGTALGDHYPGGAGELGRAADGAQVAGILDLLEGDEEVPLAQHAARVAIGIWIHLADDPLMVGRPAKPLQLLRRGLWRLPDPMNPPPPALRLGNRAAAVDELVRHQVW